MMLSRRLRRVTEMTPAVPTDPYFDDVSLLLHMDGADASTTFTDSSGTPKTVTAHGTAQIDTAQSKFGGASGLFDGNSDYLATPNNTQQIVDLGQPFTIEAWVRLTSVAIDGTFFDTRPPAGAQNGFTFYFSASLGVSFVGWTANAARINVTGGALSANTWHHVAATRTAGGVYNVWVDGVSVASGTESGAVANSGVTLRVGASNNSGAGFRYLNGHIDEARITKGIARYTAAFTPPTEAFPDE